MEWERSQFKLDIIDVLKQWNYEGGPKATPFTIARKVRCSESSVVKILRHLKYNGIVKKSKGGAWALI